MRILSWPDDSFHVFNDVGAVVMHGDDEEIRLSDALLQFPDAEVYISKRFAREASPRPSTGHPETPTEYRCNICGGIVRYDGTKPSADYPGRGRKRKEPERDE